MQTVKCCREKKKNGNGQDPREQKCLLCGLHFLTFSPPFFWVPLSNSAKSNAQPPKVANLGGPPGERWTWGGPKAMGQSVCRIQDPPPISALANSLFASGLRLCARNLRILPWFSFVLARFRVTVPHDYITPVFKRDDLNIRVMKNNF